jgi:hypothetical protein
MVSDDDVERIFQHWKQFRDRPELVRFTEDRKKLIRRCMGKDYGVEDFCALIDFVFKADDPWSKFMRDGGYTGLEELLRKSKLADRVEKALMWKTSYKETERRRVSVESNGLDLGFMGRFRKPMSEV